jgi:hypothetical protein
VAHCTVVQQLVAQQLVAAGGGTLGSWRPSLQQLEAVAAAVAEGRGCGCGCAVDVAVALAVAVAVALAVAAAVTEAVTVAVAVSQPALPTHGAHVRSWRAVLQKHPPCQPCLPII